MLPKCCEHNPQIALQDTNIRSTAPESERSLVGQQCHFNAVFDLEWMPGHMKFISASGDHTARLWEVRDGTFENVRIFNGHTRSVKTAAFRKTDSAVFATGGRDGAILIWDTRAALNVGVMPRADNCIYSGHSGGPGTPMSACKRRSTRHHTPKLPANVSSSSITGLVFQDDTTLVSCGAGDGIIKVWDLRRNYTSYKKEPLPKHSIPYPGTSTFKGYTNLMVDEGGVRLYVNCMDNSIYAYNLASYAAEPLIRYTGLRNSTFYIKSSLSPDGQYLLSGSSDEKAYIWNVRQSEPLVTLVGHTVEVTCVAWSHAPEMRVVTCSDDARHKIWRIGDETLPADEVVTHYRGTAEPCEKYWPQAQLQAAKRCGRSRYGGSISSKRNGDGQKDRGRLKSLENTPRSIRRLVAENEATPSTTEKSAMKRSFAEMADDAEEADDSAAAHKTNGGGDAKRAHLEFSKGRRLFSPVASGSTITAGDGGAPTLASVFFGGHRNLNGSNLAAILEETESSPTVATFLSTLTTPTNSQRAGGGGGGEQTPPTSATTASSTTAVAANSFFKPTASTTKQLFVSPPFTERLCANIKTPETPPNTLAASATHTFSSGSSSYPHMSQFQRAALLASSATASTTIFSPTSNLPNYVVNGEAPHLQLQSPKRKLKENVDWLTKIRKQKLLSTINAQLNEKLSAAATSENGTSNSSNDCASMASGMQSIRVGGSGSCGGGIGGGMEISSVPRCESPRLQTVKSKDAGVDHSATNAQQHHPSQLQQSSVGSPSTTAAQTPRRRTSRSGSDAANKTPSSASRARNPEHTLLRFFSRRAIATVVAPSAAAASASSTASGEAPMSMAPSGGTTLDT